MRDKTEGESEDAKEMFAEGNNSEVVQRITKLKFNILDKLRAGV